MPSVELAHPADFAGWRAAARRLLERNVPPDRVAWRVAGEPSDLLSNEPIPEVPAASSIMVPRELVELAEHAALYRDADRFTLLVEFGVRNLSIALFIEVTLLGQPEFVAFGALALVFQAALLFAAIRVYRGGEAGLTPV